MKVKSGGLQRIEEHARQLQEAEELSKAEDALEKATRAQRAPKVGDIPRSDNFRLVVLDQEEDGDGDDARSKSHASESARNFLQQRMQAQKRVSRGLFKARKRLGPSPNF
ncbi:unnamed protein product [Sphacelaria rigidula]